MSAKSISRAFTQGQIKQLGRMRRQVDLVVLPPSGSPRNPVAHALAQRRASNAAGRHIRSAGAERRAQTMALGKALKELDR